MIPDIHEILKHYPEFSGIHPACEAVPMIDPDDYKDLCEDIRANGLKMPLLRAKDGSLLDGRTRLIACYETGVEIFVQDDPGIVYEWDTVYRLNVYRRHLKTGQKAVLALKRLEYEKSQAKERQGTRSDIRANPHRSSSNGRASDKAAEGLGISGRRVDEVRTVAEFTPDAIPKVASGEMALDMAYKAANLVRKEQRSKAGTPEKVGAEMTIAYRPSGEQVEIAKPKAVKFNRTNESVDWACWTWNPVTGCEHGCSFCYAREIAFSRRMAPYYPVEFDPLFHPYRLDAPKNTAIPQVNDEREGRVFVCSMADLFGKWVPDDWIRQVFDACIASPRWEYMFLTKWPRRYSTMPLLERAWYGASITKQADVKRVVSGMTAFETDCIKWISMEPMLGPVEFDDLSWCDLMVIGSQTRTTQPWGVEPDVPADFEWVVDVINQCRQAGVPYYLKDNLGPINPGMILPKQSPRK